MARTVRRCILFGLDPLTGKNYDHRKPWIEEQLLRLAASMGIDLLAFSILSNHFHLVLRTRPDVVATWDDTEVARLPSPRLRGEGLGMRGFRPLRLATLRYRCAQPKPKPIERGRNASKNLWWRAPKTFDRELDEFEDRDNGTVERRMRSRSTDSYLSNGLSPNGADRFTNNKADKDLCCVLAALLSSSVTSVDVRP